MNPAALAAGFFRFRAPMCIPGGDEYQKEAYQKGSISKRKYIEKEAYRKGSVSKRSISKGYDINET